jgi:hypothetical protein
MRASGERPELLLACHAFFMFIRTSGGSEREGEAAAEIYRDKPSFCMDQVTFVGCSGRFVRTKIK